MTSQWGTPLTACVTMFITSWMSTPFSSVGSGSRPSRVSLCSLVRNSSSVELKTVSSLPARSSNRSWRERRCIVTGMSRSGATQARFCIGTSQTRKPSARNSVLAPFSSSDRRASRLMPTRLRCSVASSSSTRRRPAWSSDLSSSSARSLPVRSARSRAAARRDRENSCGGPWTCSFRPLASASSRAARSGASKRMDLAVSRKFSSRLFSEKSSNRCFQRSGRAPPVTFSAGVCAVGVQGLMSSCGMAAA